MDCVLIWQRLLEGESRLVATAKRPLLRTGRGV